LVKISHVSSRKWIQKYKSTKKHRKNKKIIEFIIDETAIKAGSELIWLWVAIEPKDKESLAVDISKERKKHVCSRTVSV
jgi:putative transposase